MHCITLSRVLCTTVLAVAAASSPALAADAGWAPERHVEMIVPAGAGGSLDIMGRTLQMMWQDMKLVRTSSSVVNRAGGGHAVAYAYLAQKRGDPHFLSITSPNILAGHINGHLPMTYRDFTPIALLLTESIAFAVPADSPIKTGKDMMEALRTRPEAYSIALSSAIGGTHHLAFGLPAKAAGVDMKRVKLVAFNSSGDALTAILGGHVNIISTSSASLLPHIESGKLRMIAVGAEKRLGAPFSNVPTWAELGYPGVFDNWRGVIAAAGITPAQGAYWEDVLRRISATDAFASFAQKNQLDIAFRGSADTRKYLDKQYAEMKDVMTFLGLVK
jgi:putative tricarboxylic transport membrane protein